MLRVLLLQFYAAFVTGCRATTDPAGIGSPDTPIVGEAWVQNLWINLRFDALVPLATHSGKGELAPGHQALLLALGLCQFQTTWRWPRGEVWPRWFAADPPRHWLAAHVWHLCRAAAEPEVPDHLERAHATLADTDWPQLAAALAAFEFCFTPRGADP